MWVLPSRGRPESAERLAELASGAPITLWLSEDDPRLGEYQSRTWPSSWNVQVGISGLRLAQILNEFYRAFPNLPYYGFIGDDVIPSPMEWWSELAETAGSWNYAYPQDAYWGDKLSPHFCIGGNLVRALDWFVLPKLKHSFVDTAGFALAQNLGLARYREDIFFDHVHPLLGKAEMDETYRRGQQTYEWDRSVFERWREKELDLLVGRIRAVLPVELRNNPPEDLRA